MVTGQIQRERSEITYRKIQGLNQSSLVTYDDDELLFYKYFVLGEPKADEDTRDTLLGCLVDNYLLENDANEESFNQHFDEHFVLFEGNKGTAQVFMLCDELFDIVKRTIVDGEITGDFIVCFQEAFLNIQSKDKYKGKTWQKGLEDFNANGKEYYNTLLRSIGRKVVDLQMIETIKRISSQMISDEHLGWIFASQDNAEVLNKFPIEFKWYDFDCKMEADKIMLFHDEKIIQPYDLKITYDSRNWAYSYIKRKYYIQNSFYWTGIGKWAESEGLGDYVVNPMHFIVGDSSVNQRRPLLYETSMEHIKEGLNGFTFNRKRHRGINELITSIAWHQDTQIWNSTPENYRNGQIVKLQTFNEV